MNFIRNLQYLIEEKQISKNQLAKEINVSKSTVFNWFTPGHDNIKLSYLVKLSRYFNVTIDDLVEGDLSKNKRELKFSTNNYNEHELEIIKKMASLFEEYKLEKVYPYKENSKNIDMFCSKCNSVYQVKSKDIVSNKSFKCIVCDSKNNKKE